MANRQITRRILITSAIAVFVLFVLFIRPQGPPSPAVRAPGHIDKSAPAVTVKDDLLKGEVIMPRLGNETAKAELGRATWKYFHTMLARYPEDPTEEQQETLRSFILLFARLYPCGECASHFQGHLKKYPPQVSSRNAAAGWGCFIHNEVNTMLGKPEFDCNNIGDFYDCGCAEDEKAAGHKDKSQAASRGVPQKKDHEGDATTPVEIHKEPAPPPAPSPPPTSTEKPSATTTEESKSVNVFDYLVTADTPNASKVSLGEPKEQMKMVDHAPSVFEPSKASVQVETDNDDEKKDYDVAYEENGFSYGAGPIQPSVYPGKAPNVSMEFMTPAPKKKKDRTRGENDKASATTSDKKRKRRTDDHNMDIDSPMAEAPSSVVNNPGTPMLKHSGLTGGLNRMMRSPSTEDGNESKEDSRRRYQDPSSPIKRTRRDHKDGDNDSGLGISIKQKAGRLVSSMFGGSAVSGSSNNSQEPEARRSKQSHRVASPSQDQMPSDSRKTKRKVSAQAGGDRPSQRLKQIEYNGSQHGDDGREVVVYRQENIPNDLQRQMAAHFLSLVTKGPESSRGFSVNKVLKRFHREFTDEFDDDRGRGQGRSRADRERRIEDEKDLWRTLRLKRNERGEVVLFF
ncbi:hypothetical protein KXX13_008121 [Aspergillus fumigatus]|nr:hypothetical protein KXX11_000925 [Aspergillus fumigatus]KAH1358539.1 hypothetical protein KXX14_009063 [Aspergillus fumigatus]KAH1395216.1 hypothetical protein KXX49_009378 [Aspergillus fumigatus]KAH1459717.1 hypothetical protein KXX13_008121 [Aspergillus fumigatus]KAH1639427.1 hypothetical protein KXX39_003924 [Aspergillus fumigatus]